MVTVELAGVVDLEGSTESIGVNAELLGSFVKLGFISS
jgi:hypothetical protein